MTVTQVAWGAGLLEGEGYFSTNGPMPSRRTPMVGLNMTDRDIVERFRDLFAPDNTVYETPSKKGHKTTYAVKIVGKQAVGLMFTFFSFLGLRRRERIKELISIWQAPRKPWTPKGGYRE